MNAEHFPSLSVLLVQDGVASPFGVVIGRKRNGLVVYVLHEVNGYKPGLIVEGCIPFEDVVPDDGRIDFTPRRSRFTTWRKRRMKEHREKNARIPPGSACSAVPGLSVEPPPLGTDCGFTAFHSPGTGLAALTPSDPGCLHGQCSESGCDFARGGLNTACRRGCWWAQQSVRIHTEARPNLCPEVCSGCAENWAGAWEIIGPELLGRFDALGRPVILLEAYEGRINGTLVTGWRWVVEQDLGGSALGYRAFASAIRDSEACATSRGWTLSQARSWSNVTPWASP